MLDEYIEDNYYAKSDIQSYHRFRDTQMLDDVNHGKATGA